MLACNTFDQGPFYASRRTAAHWQRMRLVKFAQQYPEWKDVMEVDAQPVWGIRWQLLLILLSHENLIFVPAN
jgi:hypothetical protein